MELRVEPKLPIKVADGPYASLCYGKIISKNGVMTLADRQIGYVAERNGTGPILSQTYLAASANGLAIRSDAYDLTLRLDQAAHPQQVELPNDGSAGRIIRHTGRKATDGR